MNGQDILRKLPGPRPAISTIVVTALASAYLAAAIVLEGHLDYTGDLYSTYPANFMTAIGPIDILTMIVLALALFAVLDVVGRLVAAHGSQVRAARSASAFSRSLDGSDEAIRGAVVPGMTMSSKALTGALVGRKFSDYLYKHRYQALAFAAVAFVCWLPIWSLYYPGTSMNDQLGIINDPIAASNGHPILYCLALSGLVKGSQTLLGDGSIGFGIYVLLQMAFCAGVVGVMCSWLRWRGAKAPMAWIVVALFALTPIVADNVVCSIKDTLFNFVLLLWIPFFDELVRRRAGLFKSSRERWRYVLLIFLTGVTRNNGIIVAGLLVIGVIALGGKKRGLGKAIGASVLGLVLMMAPNTISRALFPDVPYNASEALGVPVQQLAAVYVAPEGTLTDEQMATLGSAIDLDAIPQQYYPVFVDGLKFQGHMHNDWINANRDKLLQTWVEVAFANPANFDVYVRAWFSNTYGCWGPLANPHPWQSYFFKQLNNEVFGSPDWYQSLIDTYNLQCRSLLVDETTATQLRATWEPLVVSPGTGALFFIVLVLAVLSCHREGGPGRGLLPYWPLILLWLSLMLSVPLSTALRYGLSLLLAVPFLVCLLLMPINRAGQEAATLRVGQMQSVRDEWPF